MGRGSYSDHDWKTYSTSTSSKPRAAIFTSTGLDPSLDPSKFKFRESCDSPANPKSTPIILACDETGSMGSLAETIIKKDLGVVMGEVVKRKPISDPHMMVMGIGDAYVDHAPCQATQFETEVDPLTKQIEKIYLEGGGGGNFGESYLIAWYFAAFRTKIDSALKRKKKGYMFTIGDEAPLSTLTKEQIKRFFGDDVERDMTAEELRDIASKSWELFHIIVKPVHPIDKWKALLGERAIVIPDHTYLGEVIVSTLEVIEGTKDSAATAATWSGKTAMVVAEATKGLTKGAAAGQVARY